MRCAANVMYREKSEKAEFSVLGVGIAGPSRH